MLVQERVVLGYVLGLLFGKWVVLAGVPSQLFKEWVVLAGDVGRLYLWFWALSQSQFWRKLPSSLLTFSFLVALIGFYELWPVYWDVPLWKLIALYEYWARVPLYWVGPHLLGHLWG